MTDMVNIVESVCQDPGRPAPAEREAHSQNIVPSREMRPGNTGAPGCPSSGARLYISAFVCASPNNNGPLQIRRKIKVERSLGLAVQQEGLLLAQCGRKENVDFKRFKACLTVRKKVSLSG